MRFSGRTLFTIVIGLVLLGALLKALQWPLRTSILIYFICGICLLLVIVELYREMRARPSEETGGSGMDVPLFAGGEASRDLLAWGWLLGLLLGIWLIGFVVAVPLFTLLFSKVHGARWRVSLFLAALAFGTLYGLFGMVINVPWPEPFILTLALHKI
jgi:hypothetical protein